VNRPVRSTRDAARRDLADNRNRAKRTQAGTQMKAPCGSRFDRELRLGLWRWSGRERRDRFAYLSTGLPPGHPMGIRSYSRRRSASLGSKQLFVVKADGTEVTQITSPSGANLLANWGELRVRIGG
jgi:hypothetical protein